MRFALIYNRNQRVALGERCLKVLKDYPRLKISQFDLKEIQNIKTEFDFYLRIDDGDYSLDLPSGLRPCAFWVADTHLPKPYRRIKAKVKNYDFVFCMQKEGAQRLSKETKKNCFWVPWAEDEVPSDFRFIPDKEKVYDICFIGTEGKYSLRKVVLEILKINYKNFYFGRVPYTELFNYYSKARIVVNYPINNDINARIFEAMSGGALVITHRIKDNGFEDIFQEGSHLVVFDEILKELKLKIDYYLGNKDEREEIAHNGFEYVKNNHTYRHRLKEIFKIIGFNLEKFR
ncbi:MAG: glycosyltransferase [Candidatus Omnitrophica bacterium]|nr:glycosyltransferase [Candidatus Omnitrophota bacterium]